MRSSEKRVRWRVAWLNRAWAAVVVSSEVLKRQINGR